MKNYFIQTTNTHYPFVASSYFPRKLVRYAFFQFCSPLALCMKRLCITISVQIKKEESTSAPIGSDNNADTAMPFDEMNWCCSLKIHRIFCVYDTPIYQNNVYTLCRSMLHIETWQSFIFTEDVIYLVKCSRQVT